jgi:transposase InsO family protein
MPNSIITDNDTQFTSGAFLQLCEDYGISLSFSAVAHPRTNGQVERANGLIMQGIKPWIFDHLNKFAGKWVVELPSVLWSLRTTPKKSIGYTPFFMVYGVEAVLPTDLDYGSPCVRAYIEDQSEEARQDAVDRLEEAPEVALLWSAKYQQGLRRYNNR